MVKLAVLCVLALPSLSVGQFAALANVGNQVVRTALSKILRFNETQIEKVMAQPNVTLPPHEFAVDLTDENWEAMLRTGTPNPLAAPLPEDTVWVVTVHGQDQFSKMFIEATDAVAQDNSSAAGGTLPPQMRFARLNYGTETILTTRWWVWRVPVLVIATNNHQTLRFLKLGSIPPFQDKMSQFLADAQWWHRVPAWTGLMAPGGALEVPLQHLAKAWAFYHYWLSRIPNFVLLILSGALMNVVVGFFHTTPAATPVETTAAAVAPISEKATVATAEQSSTSAAKKNTTKATKRK